MVLQVAAAVIIPFLMMIVATSPFDEPISVEPNDPTPENTDTIYITFFILWIMWLLLLTRILYQVGRRTFRMKKAF